MKTKEQILEQIKKNEEVINAYTELGLVSHANTIRLVNEELNWVIEDEIQLSAN